MWHGENMKRFIRAALICYFVFLSQCAFAGNYKVLVLPDNIVTENVALDSYIYEDAAEFFSDEVVNILNTTDNINSPQVSQVRTLLKKNDKMNYIAKNLTSRFRTSYNVDYDAAKKIADKTGNRYVLMITSALDAENYILRRTWWDFFNIAGASVVDPAYKINTYAVLIDTKNNQKLWSDTYYKTISTVENRIITRGPSPQTEQLAKIKDYSRYLCPQIAQNVQLHVLPPDVYASENTKIDYDIGNIDNIFTKKYRHWGKEYNKIYAQKKESAQEFAENTKTKYEDLKTKRAEARKLKEEQRAAKLEVKATPVYQEESGINKIKNSLIKNQDTDKNAVYKVKQTESQLEPIEIKKTRYNRLFGGYDEDKPDLRDYSY